MKLQIFRPENKNKNDYVIRKVVFEYKIEEKKLSSQQRKKVKEMLSKKVCKFYDLFSHFTRANMILKKMQKFQLNVQKELFLNIEYISCTRIIPTPYAGVKKIVIFGL